MENCKNENNTLFGILNESLSSFFAAEIDAKIEHQGILFNPLILPFCIYSTIYQVYLFGLLKIFFNLLMEPPTTIMWLQRLVTASKKNIFSLVREIRSLQWMTFGLRSIPSVHFHKLLKEATTVYLH